MIVIGVPVPKDYGIDVRTAAYCSTEASRHDAMWGYVASRDAGVGRSTFIHNVLKSSDVTHLYFMDYDVVPPNGTLQKLLDYNIPIVAGIYKMNTNIRAWSFKTGDNWYSQKEQLPEGLIEATCVGGSTLLMKREVLENLESPCFKIEYRAIDEKGRCYDEGEDEYFSRIAREAGYKLMIDPTIICKHFNYREL